MFKFRGSKEHSRVSVFPHGKVHYVRISFSEDIFNYKKSYYTSNIPKSWDIEWTEPSKCLTASEFGIGHSLFMIAKIHIWDYQLLYAILFLFNLFLCKICIKLKLILKTEKVCSRRVLFKQFHHFLITLVYVIWMEAVKRVQSYTICVTLGKLFKLLPQFSNL